MSADLKSAESCLTLVLVLSVRCALTFSCKTGHCPIVHVTIRIAGVKMWWISMRHSIAVGLSQLMVLKSENPPLQQRSEVRAVRRV